MAVLKCKMCGGSLEILPGATICECEYCGTKQTLPQAEDEQKLNRYDRANHFRTQCEFDKAVAAYEKLLEQDENDAEAHWGAVISRFGIEYVEDPATKRRVPTCHRVQVNSILADADYLAAVKNAPDSVSAALYKEQAAEIAEIQKGILAISANEKPYDVFICYKETDENGQRTRDSALAQEVYYGLTQEGYKVFFSRITLEDKLGQQYEPYIFAALNSARVMVVIGTKPEYFNAVWVKNEWSRYLMLMAKDRKRLLIPCYRGMDPYDLPEELSSLQSQDMAKIGFMQDLLRGIKKVLVAEEGQKPVKETVIVNNTASAGTAEPLIKRGYMSLEDGNYEEADGYFERALDTDAENARAYLGKLFAAERVPNGEALQKKRLAGLSKIGSSKLSVNISGNILEELKAKCANTNFLMSSQARTELENINRSYASSEREAADALQKEESYWKNSRFYNRALQFAAGAQKKEIGSLRDTVLSAFKERAAEEKKKAAERRASTQSAADSRAAAIRDKYMAKYAQDMENAYNEALKAEKTADSEEAYKLTGYKFQALGKYEDAHSRAEKCTRRAETIRAAAEKKAKRKKITTALILIALAAIAAAYFFVIKPAMAYSSASSLLENGQYSEAKTAFLALETYKDSPQMAKECDYQAAKALFDKGEYEKAKAAFEKLGNYSDAETMVKECDYQAAQALYAKKDYAGAYTSFSLLKGYKDVDTLLATDDNLAAAAIDAAWQPGKYVTFGTYEQDNNKNNGKEAIEWLVLARNGNKALVLSRYGLDAKPYNKKWESITWEKCTLRSWLNGEFYNTAFTAAEQARIQLTSVDNGKSQGCSKWSTNGGNNTKDRVFLLSYAEANKYLGVTNDNSSNTASRVSPTAYAKANGAYVSNSNKTAEGANAGWWWLRSPGSGSSQRTASYVYDDGSLFNIGVDNDDVVVRPALWVEIS